MKFSSGEEYGLRCLLQIARAGAGASMTIQEIATAEGLSESHVAKIMRQLRMHDFVVSARGREGGYTLAKPAEKIMLGHVIDALGGRMIEEDFCDRFTGTRKICVHSVDCAIISLWEQVQDAIDSVLYETRLSDLLPSDQLEQIRRN